MMAAAETTRPETASGWLARLETAFDAKDGKTVLTKNRHRGPLRIQKPLYPETAVCHATILHPPGGIVSGDRLETLTEVNPEASVLVTTPGATKFYRSGGCAAVQENRLLVRSHGCLEWFPQETIVFPGADAWATTRVDLEEHATFMGWEIYCIGLPACGSPFSSGVLQTAMKIYRNGLPLFFDRARIEGGDGLSRPTGVRGFPVMATFIATGCTEAILVSLRKRLPADPDIVFGVTLMDDLLVARVLSHSSSGVKLFFETVWGWLRPDLTGRIACAPRIWAT